MPEQSLKERTAKGLLWGGVSNGIVQLLNLAFGICLLNLLTPEDYGTVQILAIFSSVATCLQDSGFTVALANKKSPTHADYNAVFWFSVLCGAFLYVVLFFCAPLIARFYHDPLLVPLARFSFLNFLISSWGVVQRAYLFGHLMVKESSIISISALIISGTAGIIMALCGLAYWGLAAQGVIYVSVITIMRWYYSPWRPTMQWDFRPVRQMFKFSSKLLITSLFLQINKNVFSVLLGLFYPRGITGQYGNAYKWNDMGSSTINNMLNEVAQPVLTQAQDNPESYNRVFRKMLRFASFLSFPAMLGLALVAHPFILICAGEKWLPSVPMLQILCVYGAFFPLITLYSNLIISQGRSNINLFNTITTCVLIWISLYVTRTMGIYLMIVSFVSINVLWLLIWHGFAHKLIGLRLWDVLCDILPFLGIAIFSMGATWLITKNIESTWLLLLIRIVLGAGFYIGLLFVFRAKILRESLSFLRCKLKA